MGQKTHPYAFRIGIVNDWKSRWFSDKDYTKLVNQDYRIREFLSSQLIKGAVSRIDIVYAISLFQVCKMLFGKHIYNM